MLMEEPSAASGLAVSLLGPVDVLSAGEPAGIAQPALRMLLAMLALSANRAVSVAALIDALWQEDPSRQRERNLHVQVHQLRRRLAELEPGRSASRVVTAAPGYLLVLGPAELDVQSFESLASQGRELLHSDPAAAADRFREALALWRGPALADVAPLTPRLGAEAASLDEHRLSVLEDRAEADVAAGRGADLIGELTGLVAQFPLRERLRGQLMVALYRGGRRGDALAAYREGRQVLKEELGLDPGHQLQDLHEQILRGDPRLAAARTAGLRPLAAQDPPLAPGGRALAAVPVPRQLPAEVRHFVVRAAEQLALDRLLAGRDEQAGGLVIAAMDGTAGVGKTALAVHWAHRVAGQFPDGQLYVNLRGYDPSGAPVAPAEAIRWFLEALGVPPAELPASPDAQAGLYRSLLATRRMLILLDNALDPAQVRPLLPGSSGCLVIVTSRAVLSGLAATEGAQLISLELLAESDSRALLSARLGAARLGTEPEAIDELVRICAGLPLALAIAAARGAQTRQRLALLTAELAGTRLDALDAGEPAASIRAVLSWSYRQLTDPAARMFRLLGTHPGPDISIPAAASLCGVSPRQARRLLAQLTAASLLAEHRPGRYACHDLLRAYAAELAGEAGSEAEHVAAVTRYLDHYVHTAHAAAQLMAPVGHPIALSPVTPGVQPERLAGQQEALAWFRAEHQVLLAVIACAAADGHNSAAWQLPWTMRAFLDGQGYWLDWAAVNEVALAAAGRLGDHNGLGWTMHRIAQVCSLSGAVEDGIARNKQAIAEFRLAGNPAGQGSAHLGLSISLGKLGRHLAALGHARLALRLFRDCDDRIGLAYALHLTGLAFARLGNAEQGRDRCWEAVELYRDLGDQGGLADAWHSLASVHYQLGEHDAAAAGYQQAISTYAALGDRWGQAYCLINLGDTYDAAEDEPGARQAWAAALEIIGDVRHPDADRVRARLAQERADKPGVEQADN
jgi:DNA-binding SARP family transcriptional activator